MKSLITFSFLLLVWSTSIFSSSESTCLRSSLFKLNKNRFKSMINDSNKIALPESIDEKLALLEAISEKKMEIVSTKLGVELAPVNSAVLLVKKKRKLKKIAKYLKGEIDKNDIDKIVSKLYVALYGDYFGIGKIFATENKTRKYLTRLISENILKEGLGEYLKAVNLNAPKTLLESVRAIPQTKLGKVGITILFNIPILDYKFPLYLPKLTNPKLAASFLESCLNIGFDKSFELFKTKAGFELSYNSFKQVYMKVIPLFFMYEAAKQISKELDNKSDEAGKQIEDELKKMEDAIDNNQDIPLKDMILNEMITKFKSKHNRDPSLEEITAMKKKIKF